MKTRDGAGHGVAPDLLWAKRLAKFGPKLTVACLPNFNCSRLSYQCLRSVCYCQKPSSAGALGSGRKVPTTPGSLPTAVDQFTTFSGRDVNDRSLWNLPFALLQTARTTTRQLSPSTDQIDDLGSGRCPVGSLREVEGLLVKSPVWIGQKGSIQRRPKEVS